MRQLTVKSKLIVLLLLITATAMIVIGYLSWLMKRNTVNEITVSRLVNLRANQAKQIETYIDFLRVETAVLAEDFTIIDAMTGLNLAYGAFYQEEIAPAWDAELTAYYERDYLPVVVDVLGVNATLDAYRPTTNAGRFLQFHYIAENPNAERAALDGIAADAVDSEVEADVMYNALHAKHHPRLRAIADRLGFSDLILVGYNSEDVIYSVAKNPDLGMNVREGPYSHTHLAELVFRMKQERHHADVHVTDFAFYPPMGATPVAFLASTIYNAADRPIGILVIQVTPTVIDGIVTNERTWADSGLGRTGETYIVGPDRLLRTTSRFMVDASEDYPATLRASGHSEHSINRMEQLDTSILLKEVDTYSAREALAGRSGNHLERDYRGQPVLAAYAPLAIEGLNWGIVTKIDTAEAFAPVVALQQRIFIVGTLLILGVTLLAMAASNLFYRPIHRLTEFADGINADAPVDRLDMHTGDDFGKLAQTLNEIADKMQRQTQALERRSAENQALLHSVVPASVAQRIRRGEEQIVDTLSQVSVLSATVTGFLTLLNTHGQEATITLLNRLITDFDAATEQHGLERQRTVGHTYMAVCGLATSHLDHSRRTVDCALEMFDKLDALNQEHDTDLALHVGIQSGSVVAGIVGGRRFMYNVWGETVQIATALQHHAERNTLLTTDAVYDRLENPQRFTRGDTVEVDEIGPVATWMLSSSTPVTAQIPSPPTHSVGTN